MVKRTWYKLPRLLNNLMIKGKIKKIIKWKKIVKQG
jgi:hypothetical protein